jgi:spermidine synthase
VSVELGDVVESIARARGKYDAILLDVDNGPDFLVHDVNEHVYRDEFVTTCAGRLADEGLLSVWSMADSDALRQRLAARFEEVSTEPVDVRLQGRDERYWILAGRRPRRRAIVPT